MRRGEAVRKTTEVDIHVSIALNGRGVFEGGTGIRFLDHLLTLLSKHGSMDLNLQAKGDLKHHIIEDVGISLGQALSKALAERKGIKRFGFAYAPMDDALARAVVDLGGRTYPLVNLNTLRIKVEDLEMEDLEHFLSSFADSLRANIHIEVLYGSNDHHKVEAAVKALALALKGASEIQPGRRDEIPSTKGML
ncbi:MAG: imidazoleglycerol-phosphate dehydratase [Candidatus Bathyarchaeia archaeon]